MPVNEILIGAGTTAFGALLSWSLTNVTSRRSEAKADRTVTRAQADALIVAVFELRGLTTANQVSWEGWKERAWVGFLAVTAAWSGITRA